MFTGEHERLLDEKGRLVLPPNFRRHLQDAAFIAKSLEAPCLMVYSAEEIEKVAERLIEQVQGKKVTADAQRRWSASISEVKTDTQGRIAIPTKLRNEIGLEREAVLIGVINRLEIWIPNEWNRIEGEPESELTESVWL
ncbi:MAG: cell division/cell wall cluster transcriptional repressor MraZ [Acidimicrobiaceae bacterium]|nr:cell division/cell wall cluster transcriptional repressor MraZ [Acidimicrobiaceae bacterium]|tara:strand:- start:257 stop:673 length:417 start_codon:yes stop_codon:yes gene_type:complete